MAGYYWGTLGSQRREVLTNLDLVGNNVGDEGATALASALRVNGVLPYRTGLDTADTADTGGCRLRYTTAGAAPHNIGGTAAKRRICTARGIGQQRRKT